MITPLKPIDYIENDWSIFPCHTIVDGVCTCRNLNCEHAGKHPATKNGFKDASSDAKQVAESFNRSANVGLPTGAINGILVIDIDPRHGGDKSLVAIEEQYGPLPETVEVETGWDGRHVYLGLTEAIQSKNNWRAGIDIKGEGGYDRAAIDTQEWKDLRVEARSWTRRDCDSRGTGLVAFTSAKACSITDVQRGLEVGMGL